MEKCVKNVLIRRNYRPSTSPSDGPIQEIARDLQAGKLTMEELESRYVTILYAQTGSYEEAARRLGIDRRTVKAKVDLGLLRKLRNA